MPAAFEAALPVASDLRSSAKPPAWDHVHSKKDTNHLLGLLILELKTPSLKPLRFLRALAPGPEPYKFLGSGPATARPLRDASRRPHFS